MRDFNSILLLHSLRVALDSLNRNPELDQQYSGIVELKRILRQEIESLEPRFDSVETEKAPDDDPIRLNWIIISSLCLSMIFSENRRALFRIML